MYVNADEWASGIKFGTKMRPFVGGERNDDAFRFDGTTVSIHVANVFVSSVFCSD